MTQLTINLPDNAYEALQLEAKQRGEPIDKLIIKYLSLAKFISNNEEQKDKTAWPDGFIGETAGSFADDPLVRAPQGNFEKRLDFK